MTILTILDDYNHQPTEVSRSHCSCWFPCPVPVGVTSCTARDVSIARPVGASCPAARRMKRGLFVTMSSIGYIPSDSMCAVHEYLYIMYLCIYIYVYPHVHMYFYHPLYIPTFRHIYMYMCTHLCLSIYIYTYIQYVSPYTQHEGGEVAPPSSDSCHLATDASSGFSVWLRDPSWVLQWKRIPSGYD